MSATHYVKRYIRRINTFMRAWELYEAYEPEAHLFGRPGGGAKRKPVVSLRHIHNLKNLKARRRAEREQRRALWGLMYGQDDITRQELDQREAKVAAREDELCLKELKVDIDKAINHAEIDQKAQQRLHQMAMADLRRRQKTQRST